MKSLLRWILGLFALAMILVTALILFRNEILRSVAERRLHAQTGLEVKVGKFEVGLRTPTVTINNLILYNTEEFGGSPLIDLPELHIECEPAALTSGKLHFKLIRIHLNEVNIVESKDGKTNIVSLMSKVEKQMPKNAGKHKDKDKDRDPTGGFEFVGIDTLNLTLGKVKYSSLQKPKKNAEIDLDLKDEVVTNVTSYADLSGVLLKLVLRRGITLMSGPGNFLLNPLPPPASGPASNAVPSAPPAKSDEH